MAMDVVANYMKGVSRIKQALIIGSFNISSIAKHDDSVVYPNFADAAAAILLEYVEEEALRSAGYRNICRCRLSALCYISQMRYFQNCR